MCVIPMQSGRLFGNLKFFFLRSSAEKNEGAGEVTASALVLRSNPARHNIMLSRLSLARPSRRVLYNNIVI